jgi:hypothetical protein
MTILLYNLGNTKCTSFLPPKFAHNNDLNPLGNSRSSGMLLYRGKMPVDGYEVGT